MIDFPSVEATARALILGRPVAGDRFNAGPWLSESGHRWAVSHLDGRPVLLAHDAFEIALAFVKAEAGDVPDEPLALETDAAIAEHATAERRANPMNAWYGMAIDARRETLAKGRAA